MNVTGVLDEHVEWKDDEVNKSKDSIDESEIGSLKDDSLDEEFSATDIRELDMFKEIFNKIEKDLSEMRVVINELNKMRDQAAALEADLVSKMDCATWGNVSELIGISSTTMIDECMKILDLDNMNVDRIGPLHN